MITCLLIHFEGDFVDDNMPINTGENDFVVDLNRRLEAIFSGGDVIINEFRLYHLVLKNPDGSAY